MLKIETEGSWGGYKRVRLQMDRKKQGTKIIHIFDPNTKLKWWAGGEVIVEETNRSSNFSSPPHCVVIFDKKLQKKAKMFRKVKLPTVENIAFSV